MKKFPPSIQLNQKNTKKVKNIYNNIWMIWYQTKNKVSERKVKNKDFIGICISRTNNKILRRKFNSCSKINEKVTTVPWNDDKEVENKQ